MSSFRTILERLSLQLFPLGRLPRLQSLRIELKIFDSLYHERRTKEDQLFQSRYRIHILWPARKSTKRLLRQESLVDSQLLGFAVFCRLAL